MLYKTLVSLIIIELVITISTSLYAQKQIKKETTYYLLDTAMIPPADRMFIAGQEGDIYGYRLTCKCNPRQADVYFTRKMSQNGIILNRLDLLKYKFITLRKLIDIVVKFGRDGQRANEFYFVEPQYGKEDQFILYNVYLTEPHNENPLYDIHK
jgi:hypothetical protein